MSDSSEGDGGFDEGHGKHPDIWMKLDEMEGLVKRVSNDGHRLIDRMKRIERQIEDLQEEVKELRDEVF